MDERTTTATQLMPAAWNGLFEKMEELRILRLLEESEREAEQGVWLTHEEVFSELRRRLDSEV